MNKRWALITLTAASPLAMITFTADLDAGPALFATLAAVFPAALMAIGAERRDGLGRQIWPILGLMVVLLAVMAGLFAFRGQAETGPWWGGLPAAAAIQLYGLFLLPLLISSLGYAWTFDRGGLTQDDLDDLRARFPRSLEVDEDGR